MEYVAQLIRGSGDGAFAIDRTQRIVSWNDSARQMLGVSAREAVGRPCYEVLGGRAEDGCQVCQPDCPALRMARKDRQIPTRDLQARTPNGQFLWLSLSTIAVPSTWREQSCLVHLFRDITSRKQLERNVQDLFDVSAPLSAEDRPARTEKPLAGAADLTSRERQILQLLATGAGTRGLAASLCITEATVRNHIHNILSKLRVHNRLEAVTLALRSDMLSSILRSARPEEICAVCCRITDSPVPADAVTVTSHDRRRCSPDRGLSFPKSLQRNERNGLIH